MQLKQWSCLSGQVSTTQSFRKEYSLRKQESTSSKKSAKKKDGTLQKIGDFFQSSPTIIHSKGLYRINKAYSMFSGHWWMTFFFLLLKDMSAALSCSFIYEVMESELGLAILNLAE